MAFELYLYQQCTCGESPKQISRFVDYHMKKDAEKPNKWFITENGRNSFLISVDEDDPEIPWRWERFKNLQPSLFTFYLEYSSSEEEASEAFLQLSRTMAALKLVCLNVQSDSLNNYPEYYTPETLFDHWKLIKDQVSGDAVSSGKPKNPK